MLLAALMGTAPPPPPEPVHPLPSEAQLAWQQMEFYAFVHFGPNTFTNVEWGDGQEDPNVFQPSELDCRQWARTFKEAGMKGVILTAKHHDGFCLWPTDTSEHSVKASSWRDGQGDVIRELAEACREYGLKLGLYNSPWDRFHPTYGTPEYNQVFVRQIEELTTQYGELFEFWFDGANGEGPNGRRQVYDWPLFNGTVLKNMPDAIIFSDAGPGCRWVGNEAGFAGETCWSMLDRDKFSPGVANQQELNTGHENGSHWVPAECDVSIRPGWFYHPEQDEEVKSLEQLQAIWYGSVGRNGNLLLNVPPDRRGLIHENDAARLMEFRKWRDETFANDLAPSAVARAGIERGAGYEGANVNDGDVDTYWATPDGARAGRIELSWSEAQTVGHIVLEEHIRLGQRVKSFKVEALVDGEYREVARGTTVGNRRILKFDPVETTAIRVTIEDCRGSCFLIESIEAYR